MSAGLEIMETGESDAGSPVTKYTASDLISMTVVQIKALAAGLSYSITKTLKADIIAEFLAQQNGVI
jgi:hypothetical protein